MKTRHLKSRNPKISARNRSGISKKLYEEDLARARQQAPGEKLKIALNLSDLCLKLKKSVGTIEYKRIRS